MGFPDSSDGTESSCNVGDPGSIPELGSSPGEGIGYPCQYSALKNSMDCIVHGVGKSRTWLSDFHFHFQIENTEQTEKVPTIYKYKCIKHIYIYTHTYKYSVLR